MSDTSQQHSVEILERCLTLLTNEAEEFKRPHRLDDLITQFGRHEGEPLEYAWGWRFCVPSSFRAAIDIQLTPRTVDKKQTMKWTQGSWFHFDEGDTLYDSVAAYLPWNLQNFNICLDIKKASPAQPATKFQARQPGTVIFDLLMPNSDRTQLKNSGTMVMSQDEFVRLLIDGTGLPTSLQRIPNAPC